jgi:4'-phosphopantetheinyl transferase
VFAQTPLPADSVIVRWLALDTIGFEEWPKLSNLLDSSERKRASRFHFERDRQTFIAAHALTRCVLSTHAGLAAQPPQSWRFATGPQGKPEIEASSRTPPLRFNLSHTRGLVAVAVTNRHDIGVDVELVDASRLGMDLATNIFTPVEAEQLYGLPPEAQTDASFAFWTLKEAYIKATGLGLSCPLDAFEFVLDPLAVRFSSRIADDPSRWLFQRIRPTPDHVLALAVQHMRPAALRVDARAATIAELA